MNNQQNVDVYVGEKQPPTKMQRLFNKKPEVAKTKYAMIPHKSMVTSKDVMLRLSEIAMLQPGVSNYIVTLRNEHGQSFVELLEETGAA